MADNKEIGRIGQRRYGGVIYEEFLHELRGKRGIEAYREMSENDDVVGAILFAIEMLVRQTDWNVEPGGDSQADIDAAEFVESCMNDMQNTWIDTISEILSFLTFGWSYHEIVYKRRMGRTKDGRTRSKYADGLIGWRKLPIRAQETLYQWEYDDEDNLKGMTQMPPPSYNLYTIPIERHCFSEPRAERTTRRAGLFCVMRTVPGISREEYRRLRASVLNVTLQDFR